MEEYATKNDLRNPLSLEKIEKPKKANERVKRNMTELTRIQEERDETMKKLSDYQKGKILELQKSRDSPESN